MISVRCHSTSDPIEHAAVEKNEQPKRRGSRATQGHQRQSKQQAEQSHHHQQHKRERKHKPKQQSNLSEQQHEQRIASGSDTIRRRAACQPN